MVDLNLIIKFIHNWNGKLDLDVFPTIRRWTPDKEAYYRAQIGKTFEVQLGGTFHRSVRLIDVEKVDRLKFVPFGLLAMDTGKTTLEGIIEVFRSFGLDWSSPVIILTFARIRAEDQNHSLTDFMEGG